MAATVSKAGPYYVSGQIAFSSLRSNFRAQQRKTTSGGSAIFDTDTGEVRASDFRRITTTTDTNPIVPDSTENGNISTLNDWKLSQFRGSIKYYYIAQSGTDINFNISSQTWNSNLDKNIRKFLFVDGTCGSNAASSSAADFNATAYNLTIDVYGNIYACGGVGGGTNASYPISGEPGGTALTMASSGGNNIVVFVRSSAQIYGGGGGGEKGANGTNGSPGLCVYTTETAGCGGAPGCPSGYYETGYSGNCGGCCQTYSCGWSTCCSQNRQCRYCRQDVPTAGGTGGEGGNGGQGQGYTTQGGPVFGSNGSLGGAGGGCGATNGNSGQLGFPGGPWATAGQSTSNTGSGGPGGRAISGSNYSVQGEINSSTIKGAYNP